MHATHELGTFEHIRHRLPPDRKSLNACQQTVTGCYTHIIAISTPFMHVAADNVGCLARY